MASAEDVKAFFADNAICGRMIKDIRPFAFDYMIQNLDEIEDIEQTQTESAITTDSQICILFIDGNHMEIEFPGNGPIILGYNTADFSKYPQYDGSCYTLKTMFRHCIGKKIVGVSVKRSNEKMLFPCYKGIDMSEDDDGINEIRLALDDNSYLSAAGVVDWFKFAHHISQTECAIVPFTVLLNELTVPIRQNVITDKLVALCAGKNPDLDAVDTYIRDSKMTPEEVTYAAIKVCEKGAFELTNFEWINGREPNADELLTNNWAALFDVFIKYGLDANMVFPEDSECSNIMWELRNLQNGDIGATILRNLLQKGGDPNTKIGCLSFFEHVDHDVIFDVVEQEDKRQFDRQFRFWVVLMGFGGYIKEHQCPVKMAEGYDQSIFKEFEKFDYRIEYGQKGWIMHIFYKETGIEVATL